MTIRAGGGQTTMRVRLLPPARRLVAPSIALVCVIALVLVWFFARKPVADLLASVANATLFLAVGGILREVASYNSPYRAFRRIFFGIDQRYTAEGRESFYVVLPHFELNPDVQRYIVDELSVRGQPRRQFDLYRNPSVYRYMQ